MLSHFFIGLRIIGILILIFGFTLHDSNALTIAVERVGDRLSEITDGTNAGDGSGRLFLVEREGRIVIFHPENQEILEEPFLDISSKVRTGGERGLLGLDFHPNYSDNGLFYVYYSIDSNQSGVDHVSVVSEFQVSEDNPDQANVNSERIIMEIDQPERNHNGGQIKFGLDGMLYIGLGDGGGSGDRHGSIGNGQNINTLLGSMLRIDVDNGDPYAIPEDNPFAGQEGEDEIWAYGLRNPWRFSFDRETGQLFCGDVGQNQIEEVDIIERGGNYGWRLMEGSQCFNPSQNCQEEGLILPIAEYGRDKGFTVIGGFVYRGSRSPSLYGKYIFGDLGGNLFFLETNEDEEWIFNEFEIEDRGGSNLGIRIFSFAEDESGEIYVLTGAGTIHHITVPGEDGTSLSDWKWHESDYE